MSDEENTVKLNVGGIPYSVPLELIIMWSEAAPKLYEIVSENKEAGDDPIPVDGDRQLFKYVLEYMKKGEVVLPIGENVEAVCDELSRFDFHPVENSGIKIGLSPSGEVALPVVENEEDTVHNELSRFDIESNSESEQLPEDEGKANFSIEELESSSGIEVETVSIVSYCEENVETIYERSTEDTLRSTTNAHGLNYICGKIALDIIVKAKEHQQKVLDSNTSQQFSIAYETNKTKDSLYIGCLKDLNIHDEDVNKQFIETINALTYFKASKLVVTHLNIKKTLEDPKDSLIEVVIEVKSPVCKEKNEHDCEESDSAEDNLDVSTDVEEEACKLM